MYLLFILRIISLHCISSHVGYLNSQKIAEQKLQAFAIGAMGQRPLSRREQEERRKKEEEQAAASVCSERIVKLSGIYFVISIVI